MNSRPIIGVGVLIWQGEKLLLGKRITLTHDGEQTFCWQFPGGHLENNESVLACAQREVREETGLSIQAMRHLGFTNAVFSVAGRHYVTLLVSCEYESGEVEIGEPEKCTGWQWFDYKQLPSPLFEPIGVFLAQYSLVSPASQSANQSSAQMSLIAPWDDLYAMHKASSVLSDIPSDEHK